MILRQAPEVAPIGLRAVGVRPELPAPSQLAPEAACLGDFPFTSTQGDTVRAYWIQPALVDSNVNF